MAYALTADEYRRMRAARAVLRRSGASKIVRAEARATVKRLTRSRRNPRRNPEGRSHTLLWILGGAAVALFLLPRHATATPAPAATSFLPPLPASEQLPASNPMAAQMNALLAQAVYINQHPVSA